MRAVRRRLGHEAGEQLAISRRLEHSRRHRGSRGSGCPKAAIDGRAFRPNLVAPCAPSSSPEMTATTGFMRTRLSADIAASPQVSEHGAKRNSHPMSGQT